MLDSIIQDLAAMVSGAGYLAPGLAFLAGVFTAFTPCALANIPLVVAYVGSSRTSTPLRLSLLFAVGSALTFTTFAVIAVSLGKLVGNYNSWWYLGLGTVLVLMSLQIWGLFTFIPSRTLAFSKRKGDLGAFIAGILGGLFSSPCATPILVVLLGLVATGDSLAWGVLLMLAYSLGHMVLTVAAGTGAGWVNRLIVDERYRKISRILELVAGLLVLLLGLCMFYLGF